MKRTRMVMIGMVMLLGLAACGSGGSGETLGATVPAAGKEVTVSTVDEFLGALQPGVTIRMEPGMYYLPDAADFGQGQSSEYYYWQEKELHIVGLENVTIQGSGMDATMVTTDAEFAEVMVFHGCRDLTIQALTMGQTEPETSGSGVVLDLRGCIGGKIREVEINGSGTTGVSVKYCRDIAVADSRICNCSVGAIEVYETQGVTISNCAMENIGSKGQSGFSVFDLYAARDVLVEGCRVSQSRAYHLYSGGMMGTISFEKNTIENNRFSSGVFSSEHEKLMLNLNTFTDNRIGDWYTADAAVDQEGRKIPAEMLDAWQTITKEPSDYRNTVRVETVDEFLAALASDTEIVLTGEKYDLSTATGYGEVSGDCYVWRDMGDGPGLAIYGVDNLVIRSEDGNPEKHEIVSVPRYSEVISFEDCTMIELSGFTAGHTQLPEPCSGSVIGFTGCEETRVKNCWLYGCGTWGVSCTDGQQLEVADCLIYDCSYGGIYCWSVDGLTVEGTTFRNLGGDAYQICESTGVQLDKQWMEDYMDISWTP